MHGVWRCILDDDFLKAYAHGLVIQCVDGVLRRVYPRIFTYSTDYPEKFIPDYCPAAHYADAVHMLERSSLPSGKEEFVPVPDA
jgi:hypothetical protein